MKSKMFVILLLIAVKGYAFNCCDPDPSNRDQICNSMMAVCPILTPPAPTPVPRPVFDLTWCPMGTIFLGQNPIYSVVKIGYTYFRVFASFYEQVNVLNENDDEELVRRESETDDGGEGDDGSSDDGGEGEGEGDDGSSDEYINYEIE